jgi:hypothetical protein
MVWILSVPQRPICWAPGLQMMLLGDRRNFDRPCGHWGPVLKGSRGAPAPYSSFLLCFGHEVSSFATPHIVVMMCLTSQWIVNYNF